MPVFVNVVLCMFVVFVRATAAVAVTSSESQQRPPHVIFILADDMGWSDVGFHGSNEVRTPNIDALAYSGLILNSHYSENLCTPSRAALLTGKYPIRNGMQHNVIVEAAPWGLPLSETLLPERLNSLGYESHALGKWHLGFYKKAYTPTYRGFSSHYGFWSSHHDYFTHRLQASFLPYEGLDMRDNLKEDKDKFGQYTTRILTERAEKLISDHNTSKPLFMYFAHLATHAGNFDAPLQAPDETIEMFSHVYPLEKRIYAAMAWEMDQSVGRVVKALSKKGMLKDSIIVFASDNGAPTRGLYRNGGNNWPLKGEKNTPWEGALRTTALVWSQRLTSGHRVMNHLMHLSDWMPTLYAAAGGKIEDLGKIDGVSHWDFFNRIASKEPRQEILHNIDDKARYSAMRMGAYKYVNGTTFLGCLDSWAGTDDSQNRPYNVSSILHSDVASVLPDVSEKEILRLRTNARIECPALQKEGKIHRCDPKTGPCLFNILKDPCERNNIYRSSKIIVDMIEKRLRQFRLEQVPPGNKETEKLANPKYYDDSWTFWREVTPNFDAK